MSLWVRFVLAITIIVSAVLATASSFFYYSQKEETLRQVGIQHEQALKSLVKVCEESLLGKEDLALINYLRSLTAAEDVAFADVIGPDGMVTAHADPAVLGKPAEQASEGQDLIAAPVVLQGQEVAKVRIAYKKESIHRKVHETLAASMVHFSKSVVVGSFVFGLIMAWAFASGLTRPIRLLARGARRIGEGKLDERINIDRRDEIGELAQEFNSMAVKLGELDRMKEDFLQSITHDLRNPLSSISGYSQMLLQGPLALTDDRQRRFIGTIQKATTQLNEMINTILDLAKLEAGMMDLKRADVDLNALAGEVHQLFVPAADQYKIRLALDAKLSSAVSSIDAALVRRVMQNFISNALKFTPPDGTITLRVDKLDSQYRCSVIDTGPGIPPEHLKILFQKFKQVPGIESAKARGTGLGLAICKSTVEAHGGRVGVDSTVGKGSTFYFTLPPAGAAKAA